MAAPLASSIKTKNFSAKFQNILIFFSTYRRYFKHFFLLVDRTSIGIECVIIFHRFSLMYAKYFTVYFRRTIKFHARVANLMLLGRCEASWGEPERDMTVSTRLSDSVFTETHRLENALKSEDE